MQSLEEIYGPRFFARRDKLAWRAPIICKVINDVFSPESVIDVGCGVGEYVQYFNKQLKIPALGIEGSTEAIPYALCDIVIVDMRLKKDVQCHSDLAVCLEVLEHIEAEYIDTFLENLTSMSDRVLVSAAPPGAGGHHHVNCQPKKYWIEKFMMFGFGYDETITCLVKKGLEPWKHRKELYHNNLLFFERSPQP